MFQAPFSIIFLCLMKLLGKVFQGGSAGNKLFPFTLQCSYIIYFLKRLLARMKLQLGALSVSISSIQQPILEPGSLAEQSKETVRDMAMAPWLLSTFFLFCFFSLQNFHADVAWHVAPFIMNLVTLKVYSIYQIWGSFLAIIPSQTFYILCLSFSSDLRNKRVKL